MELDSLIEKEFRLLQPQKNALKKIGLHIIKDLLFYFPSRYSDLAEIKQIKDLVPGETAAVYGAILKPKTRKAFRRKIPIGEALLEDVSGEKIKVIWFNQAYMAKMVHDGQIVKLTGKVTKGKNGIYLANPELEKTEGLSLESHHSLFSNKDNFASDWQYPIYPEKKRNNFKVALSCHPKNY